MERLDGSPCPPWLAAHSGLVAPLLFALLLFTRKAPAVQALGAVVAGAIVAVLLMARARDRAFAARHPEAAWYAVSLVLALTGVALLGQVSADTVWGIWLTGLLAGGHGHALERRARRTRGGRSG